MSVTGENCISVIARVTAFIHSVTVCEEVNAAQIHTRVLQSLRLGIVAADEMVVSD